MVTSSSRRILFANVPADGHFNPLTGLAVFLKEKGYDVRWYSSSIYAEKLRRLGIPHYPFTRAKEINTSNFQEHFADRDKIRGKIGKLNFDMEHFFIRRGPEYFQDILSVYETFPFDLMIADCLFTGIPFVKEKMNIPVFAIGVVPLMETSQDLAPSGLGMQPSQTVPGKMKQAFLRWFADNVLFRRSAKIMHGIFDEYLVPHNGENVFDTVVRKSTLLLQVGTPGFEYRRSDLGENIRFIGSLLPHENKADRQAWFDHRLNTFERVLLVTQGTVEKDMNKLLVPALDAFRNTNYLVVVTTGGSGTAELRNRYPEANIIIEDFIPFRDIMPYADVYISNGGYGGVTLAIDHHLPLVVAGVHEGKNEINARIGYFKIGIDLRTESPRPKQLFDAVEKVLGDPAYRHQVQELSREFKNYDPYQLTEGYIREVMLTSMNRKRMHREPSVY